MKNGAHTPSTGAALCSGVSTWLLEQLRASSNWSDTVFQFTVAAIRAVFCQPLHAVVTVPSTGQPQYPDIFLFPRKKEIFLDFTWPVTDPFMPVLCTTVATENVGTSEPANHTAVPRYSRNAQCKTGFHVTRIFHSVVQIV